MAKEMKRESHLLEKFQVWNDKLLRNDDWLRVHYRYPVENDQAVREFRIDDLPIDMRQKLRQITCWNEWREPCFMLPFMAREYQQLLMFKQGAATTDGETEDSAC